MRHYFVIRSGRQAGQALIGYALILAVIAPLAIGGLTLVARPLTRIFAQIDTGLAKVPATEPLSEPGISNMRTIRAGLPAPSSARTPSEQTGPWNLLDLKLPVRLIAAIAIGSLVLVGSWAWIALYQLGQAKVAGSFDTLEPL